MGKDERSRSKSRKYSVQEKAGDKILGDKVYYRLRGRHYASVL
jgi:hypothetical protein